MGILLSVSTCVMSSGKDAFGGKLLCRDSTFLLCGVLGGGKLLRPCRDVNGEKEGLAECGWRGVLKGYEKIYLARFREIRSRK